MHEYSKIPETLKKLSYSIWEKYNTIFTHSWDMWDTREKLLINFLLKVFPSKYWFSSWEIFDKNWNDSWQVDIIIYDLLNSLVFQDWSWKILSPIESTYWIIEVKSTLTTDTLKESLEKINKYNNLYRPEIPNNSIVITPDMRINAWSWINFNWKMQNIPFNCIFAYDNNVAKETIHNYMRENKNIDLLVIPNKIVFFWRHRHDFWLSNDGEVLEYFNIEWEQSLWLWILYMQTLLSNIHLISFQKDKVFLDFIRTFNIWIFQEWDISDDKINECIKTLDNIKNNIDPSIYISSNNVFDLINN